MKIRIAGRSREIFLFRWFLEFMRKKEVDVHYLAILVREAGGRRGEVYPEGDVSPDQPSQTSSASGLSLTAIKRRSKVSRVSETSASSRFSIGDGCGAAFGAHP